jgi:hypothetical protein
MFRMPVVFVMLCLALSGCAVKDENITLVVQNDRGEAIVVQPDQPAPGTPGAWLVAAGNVAADVRAGSVVRFFTFACGVIADFTADATAFTIPRVTFHADGTFEVSADVDVGGAPRAALTEHEHCPV